MTSKKPLIIVCAIAVLAIGGVAFATFHKLNTEITQVVGISDPNGNEQVLVQENPDTSTSEETPDTHDKTITAFDLYHRGTTAPTQITFSTSDESIKQIMAGEDYTVVLSNKGKVYTEGSNELHGLGRVVVKNAQTDTAFGVVADLPSIASISSSDHHVLALATNGDVYAWGSNFSGQIGNNSNKDAHTPVKVSGLPKIKQVGAGYKFSLALSTDGNVYAWGGKCAPAVDRTLSSITSNITGISGGYYDPQLTGSRANNLEQDCLNEEVVGIKSLTPKEFLFEKKVSAIFAGYGHGLFLATDGTVYSFGCNLYGQLGNRGNSNTIENVRVQQINGLQNIVAVSAGFRHSLALSKDGTVYMWGAQAQFASDENRVVANKDIVKVPGVKNIKQIFAGHDYSLVVNTDGTMYGFGANISSLLQDKGKAIISTPIVLAKNLHTVGAGLFHISAFLEKDKINHHAHCAD